MITRLVSGGLRIKSQLLYAFHCTTRWINKFQVFWFLKCVYIQRSHSSCHSFLNSGYYSPNVTTGEYVALGDNCAGYA